MQFFSKEELAAFKAEAARVLSEAETKAAAKAAERLGTLKELAAPYSAKERRAYLDRKRTEQQTYYIKHRHLDIDLHGTDAETLTGILAAQLENYAVGRSDTPPAYLVIRLSEVEAARLTAQALAAELEGAKASSAETGRAELGTIREAAADALDALGLIDDFDKFIGSKAQIKGLYLALLQRGYYIESKEFAPYFKQWFGGEITVRRLTAKTVSGDDAKDDFLGVIPKRRP